jgi:hypothetical protein
VSAGHTPGPWSWFGNARNNEVYLATTHSGRHYVMGFQRWGMRGAQPTFQPAGRGLVRAEQLFTFEVGDRSVRGVQQAKADDSVYRLDINGIDCADARLIAAAPELLAALEGVRDILGRAESNASGNPEWDSVGPRVAAARAAIAKATGAPTLNSIGPTHD